MSGVPVIRRWETMLRTWVGAILLALLVGCSPPEPIRIGFVGGVSGRVADLGIAGRNGAQLAVEWRNQAGGVAGHPVELLVKDDEQKPDVAARVTRELIDHGVVAIIGPMTSAIALAMTPVANEARLLLVSPTVTTDMLSGQDDYFFRVISSTRDYAIKSARYQQEVLKLRRVAAAYDLRNRSYAESWLKNFDVAFTTGGGTVVKTLGFESGGDVTFLEMARALLAAQPDGILIIANSVDAGLLCQQIRKLDAHLPIVSSEWGSTERLVELGGKAVEGMTVSQAFDRNSTAPRYLAFHRAYQERFGQEPGFGSVAAFDAANVVLDALAARQPGQSLKQTVLAVGRFEGVQHPLNFNAFGEARREVYITVVRGGRFVAAE